MKTENIQLFLRANYSYEQLCALQAHIESGKLSYYSCCCLRGIPLAPHALKGKEGKNGYHLVCTSLSIAADKEFHELGMTENGGSDSLRREHLLPLVVEEIAFRDRLAVQVESAEAVTA